MMELLICMSIVGVIILITFVYTRIEGIIGTEWICILAVLLFFSFIIGKSAIILFDLF